MTPSSSVSIANFEQINAGLEKSSEIIASYDVTGTFNDFNFVMIIKKFKQNHLKTTNDV